MKIHHPGPFFLPLLFFFLASFVPSSPLVAHGIVVELKEHPPFILARVSYHGGLPLPGAAVTVEHLSTEKPSPFQQGKTDRFGNFCFMPHESGRWVLRADDLAGHRIHREFILGMDFFGSDDAPGVPPVKQTDRNDKTNTCRYLLKILAGTLAILALTFLSYRFRKRQVSGKGKTQAKRKI